MRFLYCPIASEHIETLTEAQAYWSNALAGRQHPIIVGAKPVTIRFPQNETHAFTREYKGEPCDEAQILRFAKGDRRFDLRRSRALDCILQTLRKPAFCLNAKMHGAVEVFGPPDGADNRMSVVVFPERGGVWAVRTAFARDRKSFEQARRAKGLIWP